MKPTNTPEREEDSITLKWGSLKAWDIHTPEVLELLKQWNDIRVSMSAIANRDTPEQKKIICEMIDKANLDTVYLDWDGKEVSKEEAKKYIMNY